LWWHERQNHREKTRDEGCKKTEQNNCVSFVKGYCLKKTANKNKSRKSSKMPYSTAVLYL
jgi:hypothetical protein